MSPIHHRIPAVLAAILLSVCALPNASADTGTSIWYDVEIIVFRPAKPVMNTELWPANPALPDFQNAVTLQPAQLPAGASLPPASTQPQASGPATPLPTQGVLPFQQLPAGQQQLNAVWQRLQTSARYQPLLHLAWTQPAAPLATAIPVIIGTPPQSAITNSPESSSVPVQNQQQPGESTPDSQSRQPRNSEAGSQPAQTQPVEQDSQMQLHSGQSSETTVQTPALASPVYGTMTLSLNRYLHFSVDLIYKNNAAATNSNASPLGMPESSDITTNPGTVQPDAQSTGDMQTGDLPTSFLLDQSRRIDAGKLNYFDNPVFGVLVLVTQRKLPAATEMPKQGNSSAPHPGDTQQSGGGGKP